MYVCVCNAIRETELRAVAHRTVGDARVAYAALGKIPQCGTCLCEADEILDDERMVCCKRVAA